MSIEPHFQGTPDSRRRSLTTTLLAVPTLLLAATGCNSDDDPAGAPPPGGDQGLTIGELLDVNGLTTLKAALAQAGMLEGLDDPGPITLVAPTDAAFAALDPAVLAALLDPANAAQLADLLDYHVLPGDLDRVALETISTVRGRNGDDLLVDAFEQEIFFNDAFVVDVDIAASNGRLHIVDTVLEPPVTLMQTLERRGLTTLVTAIDQAGLGGVLTGANVTIYAPTNEAFAAMDPAELAFLLDPANVLVLRDRLLHHVFGVEQRFSEFLLQAKLQSLATTLHFFNRQGFIPTIDHVVVSTINIPATDGVVKEIDEVLDEPVDLVEALLANGFTTFVDALVAAELDDDLRTATAPLTVFAPTNGAFDSLPPGVLDDLLDPANQAQLIQLLQYHLVDEGLQAREVRDRATLSTLEGSVIAVDPTDGVLTLNLSLNGGTDVRFPDIFAANGAVHGILDVLEIPAP
ncbi:MAG: fasciclin domain-containing protein [Planctomycetota bacterium]